MNKFHSNGVIACSYPNQSHRSFDFNDLWKGAPNEVAKGQARWKGKFSGRPELAEQIWPVLTSYLNGKSPGICESARTALRSLFRFLDAYEERGWPSIKKIDDLPPAFSTLWLRPPTQAWPVPDGQAYRMAGRILRSTWQNNVGQSRIWLWEPFPKADITSTKDLPSEQEIKTAMHSLKIEARNIFDRWEDADRLAAIGRNLLQASRNGRGKLIRGIAPTTLADAHATYRAIINETRSPLPNIGNLRRALGFKTDAKNNYPRWWPRYPAGHRNAGKNISLNELQDGLYPNANDIACLAVLYMARTGWNEATVASLDVSGAHWATPHGETASSKLWMITAWKERSREFQWTVSLEKTTTGPFQIVKRLRDRTAVLRELVKSDPSRSLQPKIAERSPWIAADSTGKGSVITLGGRVCVWWQQHVHAHNLQAAEHRKIPESMTASDWRDIYASYVFADSRYSWVIVQWALGHKHISSTRHYLRNRLWRHASERKLNRLVTVLIDGIEINERVDAVILRAKVEFDFDPSESDLCRLAAHRRVIAESEITYSGHICSDLTHPPAEIDPGNPRDGSMNCRSGERCAGCPSGRAVDGSALARRAAELTWLQRQTTGLVWAESHYAADLEVLNASLKQWDVSQVNKWMEYWRAEIASGRHKVIRFGAKQ
ncbi:hypothetical protein [Nevskia sp.]|uniref:hypothetical protein n=1 Tax=Nevskia sp. TaxID=1929292 RepID=UPI0025DAD51B|nr:hypothetical protein [Nevskia sp.]